jgi:minor extracellular serine protease Vpr
MRGQAAHPDDGTASGASRLLPLRRRLAFLALAAALVSATQAAAQLVPVRRNAGDLTLPRLRAGVIHVPRGHSSGRVRVIVTLKLPPLAAAFGRSPAAFAGRRLNVASGSSRAYLARVDAAQRAAVVRLRKAIPEATVSRRFRIVLDGVTVSLPVRRLPALARLGFVRRVYPSMRFTLALDRSPSLIGANALHAATGARGQGVKIGVVDDGVDPTNPFFNPAGYSYPPGFPKGDTAFTTPKVIGARAFPGPGSGDRGRLPLDRRESFHGTHVAGIAAGDEGTNAPAGADHPPVTGLSGVAPKAWIGNYRVFTVPTPIGNVVNTPEIVAAFESAVADGMNVINFSGGGPESDPATDATIEMARNTAAAGVVPVIASGNDRDDFGLGSVQSPGTASAAITVAAVTNNHIFAPVLSVTAASAPETLRRIPIEKATTPGSWATSDQMLVDVGSIVGINGQPVERHLCGPPQNPNGPVQPLPANSLDGAIVLVSRGLCTFVSKADRARAAGAIGMVLVDNRPGNPNFIPIRLSIPAGMISDLDGARLRDYLTQAGGRAPVRIGNDPLDIENGRGDVMTSFSSAGPTAFDHLLKPDVSAPGAQILSSTLPEFASSPFAVFDGTSMATPHVAGSAALLLQLHPAWSPQQVKSALMSTAGPAYSDTTQTHEAPVLLEGSGLVNLPRATNPLVFTDPQSLSFGDLDVSGGAQTRSRVVHLSDANGGVGNWVVSVEPQSSSTGATVDVPGTVPLAAGGQTDFTVSVTASANAAKADDYGFVVLRHGAETRRIPYLFLVTRPGLAGATAKPLKKLQTGDTRSGTSRADFYRFPDAPFGPAPDYLAGPTESEDGAEQVYVTHLDRKVANIGVSVVLQSARSQIDPFFLGSQDENDVQGYAGTPVNANGLMFDYRFDVEAAGAQFPSPKDYYVSVDSARDLFSGERLPGRYTLRSWVNDVRPPRLELLTTRVSTGRPTLAARVLDASSGVDPLSLVIGYKRVLVGAAAYDPISGLALFPLPTQAPKLTGRTAAMLEASDYQETKNVNTSGPEILPNTAFKSVSIAAAARPAVTWLAPDPSARCARGTVRLIVAASSPRRISSVRFYDGTRRLAIVRKGTAGLYVADWKTGKAKRGAHSLAAVARDAGGRTATARERVRVCR